MNVDSPMKNFAAMPHPDTNRVPVEWASATSPLTRYWKIALRWRWVILGTVLAALLTALVVTLLMTPIFRATVTLEILREEAKIVDIKGVEPQTSNVDLEFYQTQYGLLKSRSLAERVVNKLGLARDNSFLALFGREIEPSAGDEAAARQASAQRTRAAIGLLLENIVVSPVRASRLVKVSFESPDAEVSQRIANAWAENFIASNLERRFQASSYARDFLEGRLSDLRARLEESERSLVNYATQQRIINVGANSSDGKAAEQSLLASDLSAMNEALTGAAAERAAAQSKLQSGGALPEILTNVSISSLRTQRAEASAQYQKLLAQFEPDYPPLLALRSQIKDIDRNIALEEARVRQSIRAQYDAATSRQELLDRQVNSLKASFLDLRRRSIQYNIYQREVDTNRSLYDGLLQRYKEIGVAGGVGTNNVSIVDRAETPSRPYMPRPLLNLLFGVLVGVFLGLALAFALDQIDETVSDPADLEGKIGVPLLGTVPVSTTMDFTEALQDRRSEVSEAYFSVHTSLQFSTTHGVPRSLLITSTRPSEGKSSTSSTIARDLARLGRSVLLIDGDLRNPSIHRIVGSENKSGFSNVLSGNSSLEQALQPAETPNLSVLTTGPLPPNPAELLSGDRLSHILTEALSRFDHIVIDGPPVLGLADAPLLGSNVEAVVYVVESHGARAGVIRHALKRLANVQAHVIGAVLTKFQPRRAGLSYGSDYGYGYRYGKTADAE